MKKLTLDVCLSPIMLPLYDLEGKIVVVIDVLRATSTICIALEHGAKKIIPVADVEDCRKYDFDGNLLAAERKGKKVDGFKFGNSPFEYMNGVVKDKTLVLTTTNGTKAIEMSKVAFRVVAGSFLNLYPLCEWLKKQEKDIVLFCAGWKNKFNMEDTLFAGAVVHQLKKDFIHQLDDDAALAAEKLYVEAQHDLLGKLKLSSHYKRLADLGLEKDIAFCLVPNQVQVIPVLENGGLVATKN